VRKGSALRRRRSRRAARAGAQARTHLAAALQVQARATELAKKARRAVRKGYSPPPAASEAAAGAPATGERLSYLQVSSGCRPDGVDISSAKLCITANHSARQH
jgi:hypothetical protein